MPLLPPDDPWPTKEDYGYTAWNPQSKTRDLLQDVGAILDTYVELLPLTVRQIYYLLIGGYGYTKSDSFTLSLGEHLSKAHRALWYLSNPALDEDLLLFDAIRDDKVVKIEPFFYQDADDFLDSVKADAEELRLDRQRGQPRRLVLWCEAAGMVPQLQRIAEPYGIAVYSGKGFDSVTEKRRLPMQWAQQFKQPITLLRVGDLDPSGVHMFEALARDLIAYGQVYGVDIEAVCLALLPDQAEHLTDHDPPNPKDDRRYDRMLVNVRTGDPVPDDDAPLKQPGETKEAARERRRRQRRLLPLPPGYVRIDDTKTWQLEAMPPDELARIIRQAIESRVDRAAYEAVLEEEREAQQEAVRRVDGDDDPDDEPPPRITRPTR